MLRLRTLTLSFIALLLGIGTFASAQTTPVAGDIIFTQVDANVDVVEFLTLKRLNLSTSFSITDDGVCSNALLRFGESIYAFPAGLSDVPKGTYIRVVFATTGSNDTDSTDGIVTLYNNLGGLNASGEQIIAFTGTGNGAAGCGGSGTNTYISGINWNQATWLASGTPTTSQSYAPGTSTDFDIPTFSYAYFSASVSGNVSTIDSSILSTGNWTGAASGGTGAFFTKNVKFNDLSANNGGAISFTSVAATQMTIDWSGVTWTGSDSGTRYLVVVDTAAPSTPADGYTCYSPITTDLTTAPTVVTAVTTPPCTGATTGSGKVVYLGYGTSVIVSGLTQGTSYTAKIFPLNGNGNSAKMSSAPVSGTQLTTPVSDWAIY